MRRTYSDRLLASPPLFNTGVPRAGPRRGTRPRRHATPSRPRPARRTHGSAWTAHIIIHNGRAIRFEEVKAHALSVGLACGAAVFEGIRAYMNPATRRLSVFRLEEHPARLDQGMTFMRFDGPPPREALRRGVLDSIRANAPDDDRCNRVQVQIDDRGSMASTG